MSRAIFPGSFDPFTRGHADIVQRGLDLYDEIVIAIGYNEQKTGWKPVEERLETIRSLYAREPRISVTKYNDLTIDVARREGADVILRGIRNVKDFEYEYDMALVNRKLSGLETVFLPASPELSVISSSIVRELAHFGRDTSEFLPSTDSTR